MNPFQFKIPGRQRSCAACNQRFKDKDQIFSTVEGEEEAPERKDYCSDCFHLDKCSDKIWGHWHVELHREKKVSDPDECAMELFKKAYEDKESDYLYFIAQYLRRKKQLVFRSELKRDKRLFLEDPKTSEIYAIAVTETASNEASKLKERFIHDLGLEEVSW